MMNTIPNRKINNLKNIDGGRSNTFFSFKVQNQYSKKCHRHILVFPKCYSLEKKNHFFF